jgi:thymidylate synthase
MNTIDSKYQELLQDILDNGVEKGDRTGTGTISVFGRQIRHKMSQGFPLLTTKKMAWKVMVTELLWFLRGETNIKFLLDYDCHIWDGDAYKKFLTEATSIKEGYESGDILGSQPHIEEMFSNSDELTILTKEEFINKIKTDETFAKHWGDLGPIYGKQWRQWQGWMQYKKDDGSNGFGSLWYDQILQLVHSLKTNPDSRRLMVNAWNVAELEQMLLPPCHYGFQVYTRELRLIERINIAIEKGLTTKTAHLSEEDYWKWCDERNIPTRAISLMWSQRSCDFPLGIPMNIASYALLLMIIAKEVNMVPNELIGNFGDCHIYKNQIDGVKEQIGREPFTTLPSVEIIERNWYQHEMVKQHLGPKTFNDKILSYRPDCFVLKDYVSHPKIYFPLSN